jgi:hypothetical protein
MTDRNQFEAMLEALINEDQETAKEIFHNIVVAKSREIYEELLSEDFDLEEASKEEDDDKKEAKKDDDDEKVEEAFGEEDSEEEPEDEPEDDSDDVGGDATDDMIGDVTDGEEDDSEDLSDEEQTDRILDLEDALEELKAEFEQLMAGEEGEEPGMDMPAEEPGMDAGMGDMDMGAPEEPVDELQRFMEYVDKVALPKHGDNGANTKSIVAGKNDMGGTTANIAKGGEAKGEGTKGGLLNPAAKEDNAGNINVPGGNAGKTAFKKKEPGHGAEKKGAGESADNKKSLVGSR